MECIRKAIGGSELVIFKDCGYFLFIEAPGIFFDTVKKFLDRL
ncbi:MAG: alpha/beta hydrolase [Candidatus Marinimicrobia bacterium]|nr:alpha/beta hydrolase [Candidatus Neomarinimicrobiota bacterium]